MSIEGVMIIFLLLFIIYKVNILTSEIRGKNFVKLKRYIDEIARKQMDNEES